ncbi:MAG TPA: potassium channel family protein [Aromatoleum sp.]|uniref:potassium channel family protein n=1 Tax=Aromatoleum sp. TaxID=2307007 RepID=UPI002B497923|nr:potassium channel family protein [Aromatoleum sp.]HJV28584.1 potassium channel family protein [Aromatoleum sp.]
MTARRVSAPAVRNSTLPRIVVRIYFAIGILLAIVVLATLTFHHIGDGKATWSDALHMTLITITTVGYGETVRIDSLGARLFAGFLAIGGFGVLTFLFTSLTMLFMEKDFDQTLRRRRMEKRIRKLQDHYIICGFGRVGRNVAYELHGTGRHFVAIDVEQARFDENQDKYPGLLYLHGDGSDDDLLLAADIEDAKGVFAVTGDDSRNLMIIITAKQLNPTVRIVARAQETRNMAKMYKAGADAVISPDFTGGMRIASAMVRPHVVGFLNEMLKSEKKLRVEEFPLPDNFPATPLSSLQLRSPEYILLAVRDEKDWTFNPPGELLLYPGNVLIAMASPAGRAEIEAHLAEFLVG